MIRIEIYAIQMARRFDLDIDEYIKVDELCACIERILSEDKKDCTVYIAQGFLISCRQAGILQAGSRLMDNNIHSGDILMYISRGDREEQTYAANKCCICEDEYFAG